MYLLQYLGPFKCDFDEGFTNECILVQDDSDDFDFNLRIGSTPSRHTGPAADHTTGRMGMNISYASYHIILDCTTSVRLYHIISSQI